jgi:hypothetical protein
MMDAILNVTVIEGGHGAKTYPDPHSRIHAASNDTEVFSHPLFAQARVEVGGGPSKHSVMDKNQMVAALVRVFNSGLVSHKIAQLDGAKKNVQFTVNFSTSPGNLTLFEAGQPPTNQPVNSCFVKLVKNPHNSDLPILQTCVPYGTVQQGGSVTIP